MATFSAVSLLLLLSLALPARGNQQFVRREQHEASVAASGDVQQPDETGSTAANEASLRLAQDLLAQPAGQSNGSMVPLSTEAPTEGKVYEVHFMKGGSEMCWMKELPGCRQSSQACDVEYCPVGGTSKLGSCECMQVMVKTCKVGESEPHTQIWTEANVDFGLARTTHFWRAVRLKYLDSEAPLGASAKDKGKTLESGQVCDSVKSCECDKSHWYRWLLEEGRIKWASFSSDDEEEAEKEGKQKPQGGGVSIGPIPNNPENNATMTVKAFNVLDPTGKMFFVPKTISAAEEASNSTASA